MPECRGSKAVSDLGVRAWKCSMERDKEKTVGYMQLYRLAKFVYYDTPSREWQFRSIDYHEQWD